MSDLISRQAAIKAIHDQFDECLVWDESGECTANEVERVLDGLPIIEPKTGKWLCGDDMFEYAICSCCKWDSEEPWEYAKKRFRYCPWCGAKMERSKE